MALSIGVDLGGTKLAAGVVDQRGQVVEQSREPTQAQDPTATLAAIATLVDRLRERHEVDGVGVGVAGFVDRDRSVVLIAPNLGWRGVPVRARLAELGVEAVVENDANAAAWGEFCFGAGEDVDDLLLVTVGTGIGGGLVLDGAVYRGGFGVAGEVGHMTVVPDGRPCPCGNRGCWERYASGSALVREAQEAAIAGHPGTADLLARAGGDPGRIGGPAVTEAARAGDPFAVQLLRELGTWLGAGIASLAAVLDPTVVVVGGGVCEAGDLLLRPAREAFAAGLSGGAHRPHLQIRPARLGNRAGLIGAADLARG